MKSEQATPEVRKKAAELADPAKMIIEQMAQKDRTPEALAAAELLIDGMNNLISGVTGKKTSQPT